MDIPSNAQINESRLNRLRSRLSQAASAESNEETSLLQELIERVGQENELSMEQLAVAALKLAVGDQPLLVQGDEGWLKTPARADRRDDRRDPRGRRRVDRESRPPEDNMMRYRVEVGYRDRVKPGNLVGAIANESGLQGRMIGRIQIFDSHSLVDLPKGMPEDVYNALRKLKVMNRELQITQAS